MPDAFEKDFGYLMPFLDKVAAAAKDLPNAAARDELVKLVAEEKQRWGRIRQLLGGSASAAAAPSGSAAAAKPAAAPVRSASLTVGSLRNRG